MHKAHAAVGANDAETMVAEAGTPSLTTVVRGGASSERKADLRPR